MVLVPVSTGELVDKITILEIKLEEIKDQAALKNIKHELALLRAIPEGQTVDRKQLYNINAELWKVEDKLRELEKVQDFGDDFVQLARAVYKLNDTRSYLKKLINTSTKSDIVEEKSYST